MPQRPIDLRALERGTLAHAEMDRVCADRGRRRIGLFVRVLFGCATGAAAFAVAGLGTAATTEPGAARRHPLTVSALQGVAREPRAVVPTGAVLDAMIARSSVLVVGARNEPPAAKLLLAVGARRVLRQVSIWLVPSSRVKQLLAKMNTPAHKLARFVEVPRDRDGIIEPLPPAVPYAFTDPLAAPTYGWHIYAIGANQVPAIGPGFPVTVFDSGLDTSNPDFAGRPNTVLLNQQSVALNGEDYHGTMVSSTAAAALNGVGAEGIYAAAALRSYDFDYSTAESYYGGFAAATQAGPSVVNMSFGGTEASRADYEANIATFAAGSLLVAAAGNEYQSGNPTNYPGAYPHVLTVAATDQTGAPASFSSAGPQVDLAAPGVAIPVQDPQDPTAYFPVDGTSFAAPIVSAAAAWVMTARPMEKTQLFDLLRFSARDVGQAGWDERTGYGIVDLPALFSRALPSVDPQEPNDDIDQITAGAMFTTARPTVNGAGRSATLTARVDKAEDPRDVYRVAVPARSSVTLTVTSSGTLGVALWDRAATTVVSGTRSRLASTAAGSTTRSVAWANRTGGARVVFADVRPVTQATHFEASYTLRIRIAKLA